MNAINEVEVALRAKCGMVWIRSREELRVERNLLRLADTMSSELYTWTVTQGIVKAGEEPQRPETRELATALNTVMGMPGRVMLVCLDPAAWLGEPMALRTAKDVQRKLPTLAKDVAKQVVMIDLGTPPAGLTGVTLIEWPLPDREAMAGILDSFLSWVPNEVKEDVAKNGNREDLVSAMLGLSAEDAANALSRSLASVKRFDPGLVAKEKARVVAGSGLEWTEPDPRGMDAVGGLEVLKAWLVNRRKAFSPEARAYGLPAPKGCMLLGIPGCGKSLLAKCIASAWGLPLLRMDVGALFSKYVGESEGKIRQALATAETVAPAVLWIDEVEKAFAGQGGGEQDGGTGSRVFGTFLTWMQERKPGIFIIATSNDVSKLPAEFLRAGRWDEMWFVDLPSQGERKEIAKVMARRYEACGKVDADEVAGASDGSTGAEIEQAYVDAMYAAFERGSKAKTGDVLDALKARIPLSTTMREKIQGLRTWAKGRARVASAQDSGSTGNGPRAIE